MSLRCPGLSGQQLTSSLVPCSRCGAEVEIFSDESSARCPLCKTPTYKKAAPTCAKWCKAGAQCAGLHAPAITDTGPHDE
jgi:DNA-directed RNA polymerase subunit RPC12/RpoP